MDHIPSFQHQPLDDAGFIRVLTHVRVELGRILCEIVHCALQDKSLVFDALSYTWGPPFQLESCHKDENQSSQKFITCNDALLPITSNLYDALHHLCPTKLLEIPLWIDAVCIDQTNKAERNAQVAMMSQIYMRAQKVIVWLGPSGENSDMACDLIKKLAPAWQSRYEATSDPDRLMQDEFNSPDLHSSLNIEAVDPAEWSALGALLNRYWFRRTWIIQEVAFAPSLLMICGLKQVTWRDFTACMTLVLDGDGIKGIVFSSLVQYAQQGVKGTELIPQILQLIRLVVQSPETINTASFHLSVSERSHTLDGDAVFDSFIQLMSFYGRIFDSTDAKDKVYGLLGIYKFLDSRSRHWHNMRGPSPLQDLKVDYGKSVSQIYTEFSSSLLLRTSRLDLLATVEDKSIRRIHDLPSWVPDFSVANNEVYFFTQHYNASRGLHTSYSFIERTQLKTQGLAMGFIEEISIPCGIVLTHQAFLSFLQVCSPAEEFYDAHQTISEALWRTTIGDIYDGSSPASQLAEADFKRYIMLCVCETLSNPIPGAMTNFSGEDPFEAYISWLAVLIYMKASPFKRLLDLPNTEDPSQLFSYFLTDIVSSANKISLATMNKRLFRLDSGLIGLAPRSCQVGDIVLVVPGSRVPLAVRKMPNINQYDLIGGVYAHGIMYGNPGALEKEDFAEFILV